MQIVAQEKRPNRRRLDSTRKGMKIIDEILNYTWHDGQQTVLEHYGEDLPTKRCGWSLG